MRKTIPLIARLRALNAKVNKEIIYLNYGGCGVFASRIAKAIQPYVTELECAVIAYSYSYNPHVDLNDIKRKNSNLNSIRDWSNNGVSFNHVVLRFKYRGKQWYYDSENIIGGNVVTDRLKRTFRGYVVDGHLTIDEITQLSDNLDGWNSQFDREINIPKLDKAIAHHIM